MLTVVRLFPRLLHAEGAHMSTSAYTGMEATLQVSGKDQLLGPSCTASLMLPEVCLGGCSQHKILLLPPSGHSEREKCAWFVGGLTVAPGTEICFQHGKNKTQAKPLQVEH